jgi:hypothetical protein
MEWGDDDRKQSMALKCCDQAVDGTEDLEA